MTRPLRVLVSTLLMLCGASSLAAVDVRDPEGRPVVAARVEVWVAPAVADFLSLARTTFAAGHSDEAGKVALAWPTGMEHLVLIDAPGLAPWRGMLGSSSALVTLSAGRSLTGRLATEAVEGEVCARWRVALSPWSRTIDYRRCSPLAKDGSFLLAGLDTEPVELVIEAPGYLRWFRRLGSDTKLEPIELERGVDIAGRVVDPQGRPVVDARVQPRGGVVVQTDRDGTFHVAVPSLPWPVEVSAPGLRSVAVHLVKSEAPRLVRLDWARQVTGTIVTAETTDRPAVKLVAEWHRAANGRSLRTFALELDAAGRFVVDLPHDGWYDLRLTSPGFRDLELETALFAPGDHRELGVLRLDPGAGVRGRVVDENDEPIVGLLLELVPAGETGVEFARRGTALTSSSGADGSFVIAGAPAGEFELRGRGNQRPLAVRTLALAGDVPEDLGDWVIDSGCRVVGRLAHRSGQAVSPGVSVRLLAPGGSQLEALAEATTGPDGHFDLGSLALHRGILEATNGGRLLVVQEVAFEREDELCPVTLVSSQVAVRGRVLRGEDPVSGGLLEVVRRDDPGLHRGKTVVSGGGELAGRKVVLGLPRTMSEAVVGEDGSFELTALPGQVQITYWDVEGRQIQRSSWIPDVDRTELAVNIGGQRFHGQVVDGADETGVPATLRLFAADRTLVAETRANPEGRFEIDGAEGAGLQLEATADGYEPTLLDLGAAAPEAVRIELGRAPERSSVRLHFVGPNDRPAAGHTATLLDGTGRLVRFGRSDAAGRVAFEDVPFGVYGLVWAAAGSVGTRERLVLDDAAPKYVEIQPFAVPFELRCAPDRCGNQTLLGLRLETRGGLDLSPFLNRYEAPLRFSPEGVLSLGGLEPGRYRLTLFLNDGADTQEVDVSGPVEVFRARVSVHQPKGDGPFG
jgi:hypothetical protein